ncbi:carbohydrate ABC transporter permease [Hydrogenispora ethanolica]|uniref:carbohydrate ABC transporter permease n=1 Tax=Hydrogenispora ethanolica TaxID=1082276 RepID=UPI001FB544F5|nr:sugar ABC transporter permease [Hydrogenispora ethanolica]
MILPFYLFFTVFVIIPIIVNIGLSFTNYNLDQMSFIGVKNYLNLMTDRFFWVSLKNTAIYTFFTLIFTMTLGLLLAIVLNRKLTGLKFFRTSFYLPNVTSMVAVSMVWLWLYEPSHGIVNQALGWFGIGGRQWLFDVNTALGSIIVMSIWKYTGYYMVVFLAGLQGIPGYLYEAVTVDGANGFQKFIHITLPMLTPVTFFLLVTGIINNFNVFEQVNVMTGGGPMNATTTIVHQIYSRAFFDFLMGYAASLSVVLLLIVLVLTTLNFKYSNQGADLDIG